jgi:ribosomal protein S18
LFRIQFENLVQVLGKIYDDGDVAALAGEAGATASRKDRSAIAAGQRHGLDHIFNRSGNDDADWDLAVVGAISRVESAAALIEADFASDFAAQVLRQRFCTSAGKIHGSRLTHLGATTKNQPQIFAAQQSRNQKPLIHHGDTEKSLWDKNEKQHQPEDGEKAGEHGQGKILINSAPENKKSTVSNADERGLVVMRIG